MGCPSPNIGTGSILLVSICGHRIDPRDPPSQPIVGRHPDQPKQYHRRVGSTPADRRAAKDAAAPALRASKRNPSPRNGNRIRPLGHSAVMGFIDRDVVHSKCLAGDFIQVRPLDHELVPGQDLAGP